MQNQNIDETLKERKSTYGAYARQAYIAQSLKDIMRTGPSWAQMSAYQKEALDMIANKIGRIVNGDPNYVDSWHDIIGYTRLVENELLQAEQARFSYGKEAEAEEARRLRPLETAAGSLTCLDTAGSLPRSDAVDAVAPRKGGRKASEEVLDDDY